jgi:hypothetical protein
MGPPRGLGPLLARLGPLAAALSLATAAATIATIAGVVGLAAVVGLAGCGGDFTRQNPATVDSAMIARFDANRGEFVMLARILPRNRAIEEVRQHYPGVIELVNRSVSGKILQAQVARRDFEELRHAMRNIGASRVLSGVEPGPLGGPLVSVHLDGSGRKGYVHREHAPPAPSLFDADLDSVARSTGRPSGTIYRPLLGGWYLFCEGDRRRD